MAACRLVGAPRVAESHAAMECKVTEIVTLTNLRGEPLDNYLVLGEVVAFHIDDRFIRDGVFDTAAAQSLARCGYQDYAVVDKLFTLARPPGGG
jgi:flavin reductase (DIM6/NTAB) family NADH-FMN oxidoreductase RutF